MRSEERTGAQARRAVHSTRDVRTEISWETRPAEEHLRSAVTALACLPAEDAAGRAREPREPRVAPKLTGKCGWFTMRTRFAS